MTSAFSCRLCAQPITTTFVDLGMSPPCESYLRPDQLDEPEVFYPLNVRICDNCLLVQLPAYVNAKDVFSDYAYFSSYSTSWVAHAERFVDEMTERLKLDENSRVTEVASNDGYLLQHAVKRGIPSLGIEPAANVADVARKKGIPTETLFLGEQTGKEAAQKHGKADLVVGNNVYAHVPDLLDFTKGLRALVKDDGLVSLEFPHLLRLIEGRQYDTIYHEHYSYFTLRTASEALATGGLTVVDVQELPTHGGSLRVMAQPDTAAAAEPPTEWNGRRRRPMNEGEGEPASAPSDLVEKVLADERAAGLYTLDGHQGFAADVLAIKADLLEFLVGAARDGRTVAGYGAPGKGNTLLNHCGIRTDLLPYTVDRSPHKHGMHLPGTHIPIHEPEQLAATKPDYIVILPWNLREEIVHQLGYAREWGAKFVVPIPRLEVI